ncbi:MAG: hypothetical protein N2044_03145 [Cyclobacteriaceae bacterium]|nr:hypothetical protein [Cyclobacteriaceae bacterium]
MNNRYLTASQIAARRKFIQQNYFHDKTNAMLYLRYRILRPLLKSYTKLLMLPWYNEPTPWLTPAAVEILDELITREMTGFEFGSGKSTLFLAARSRQLVSVEHDAAWFEVVRNELSKRNFTNVQYHLILPDPNQTYTLPQNSYDDYVLPAGNNEAFIQYYSSIRNYPDEHFDYILVDGRARTNCVMEAIPKLKPDGFLILDNAERVRYRHVHELLHGWKKIFTTTGLTDTVFWFKP